MQDHNTLLFDSMKMSDKDLSSIGLDNQKLFEDNNDIQETLSKIGTESSDVDFKINPVKEDIKEYKQTSKDKEKAALFDHIFANELQVYFDEHKHVMSGKEKRRLKSILIKKISNGDIYINNVGKIIIRKGKNK